MSVGRAPDAGFTLIEALVAMAILATSAVALLGAVEVHIGRIGDLERRTAARWVAEAHMTALRIGLPMPPARAESLGYAWRIEETRRPTTDPDLSQVTISVAPEDSPRDTLVTMTGFIDTGRTRP